MKKIILGLVALVALMAAESNALFDKKTLTVFNASGFPAKISVSYDTGCEHWNDTVERVNSHEAHCAWHQFDAWIQLPQGQVQAQGLTFSEAHTKKDDVVVIYGPVGGKYYVSRTTDKW